MSMQGMLIAHFTHRKFADLRQLNGMLEIPDQR